MIIKIKYKWNPYPRKWLLHIIDRKPGIEDLHDHIETSLTKELREPKFLVDSRILYDRGYKGLYGTGSGIILGIFMYLNNDFLGEHKPTTIIYEVQAIGHMIHVDEDGIRNAI